MSKKPLGDFPEEKELVPEHIRRFTAAAAQWGGWLAAFTIYIYSITTYNPSQGNFAPQWVGSTFLICLFIGIAGTMVRSRMRLSQTILESFRAGVEIQRLRDEKNGKDNDC